MSNIVIFQLVTGTFVCGQKSTEMSDHDNIVIVSPIEFVDMMTQQGPQKVPMPYGGGFYDIDLTKGENVSFQYKDILTGPRAAPEKVVGLWTQLTSIVKPVENKIQLVTP